MDSDPQSPESTVIAEMRAQLSEHSSILQKLAGVPTALEALMSKFSDPEEIEQCNVEDYNHDYDYADQGNDLWNDFMEEDQNLGSNATNATNEEFAAVWQDEDDASDGPRVLSSVADALKQTLDEDISKDKLDKIKTRVKTPENCSFVCVPKVNPELWGLLNTNVKTADIKAQSNQQLISKAISCFTQITDAILASKSGMTKEIYQSSIGLCKDGIILLSAAQREANFKRMQLIKPSLNQQYAGICNVKPQGASKYLFGDSISEKLKESKSMSGIMKQVASSSRFQPYRQRPLNFRGQSRFPAGKITSFRGRPFNQRYQRLQRGHRQ